MDAILYLARTGCQWRYLPKDFPPWPTVYWYFTWWHDDGTAEKIHDALRIKVRQAEGRNAQPSAGLIDSQSVRAADSVPAATSGFDAGKKTKGRKRFIVTDTLGLLLAVHVVAASVQDRDGAKRPLLWTRLDHPTVAKIWADQGFAGRLVQWATDTLHRDLDIVRKQPGQRGFQVQPKGWAVELTTAAQALQRFLRALGVAAAEVPQDVDDAAAMYRSLLADRRVLILLDNAATVSQVRPLIPGGGDSLVVVTSRSRLAGLSVRDGAHRITLGTLPEAEAVALLRAVTRGYRPEDDADRLAELAHLCAHLPLALRIAAERAASHPHMRLDDLISDLRDESALWDALSTGIDDEAEAIRSVFTWSYRALPTHSARLFRLLGLHPTGEFSLPAAAALGELPPSRTRQLLDDLVGAHLLEQTAPDRFQFHDLLRAYATNLVQAEEPADQRQAARRRVLSWYLHTADAAQTWLYPSEDHLPLPQPLPGVTSLVFTDYNAAVDWSEREHVNFLPIVRDAARNGLDQTAWQLAIILWFARPPSSSERDWLELGRIGLEAAARQEDQRAQRRLLINTGIAHRALNNFSDGLDALEQAVTLARSSQSRSDEAQALNLIGLIHLRRRELDLADAHFVQAMSIFRDLGNSQRVAIALSNIASTRLSAGRLPEAASVIDEALAAHRALGNRGGEGNLLRIAAALRLEEGDADAARRSIDEALDIALALRDHTREGFWLLTLGDIQRSTAQYGDALTSYQRSAMLHRRPSEVSRLSRPWRRSPMARWASGISGPAPGPGR